MNYNSPIVWKQHNHVFSYVTWTRVCESDTGGISKGGQLKPTYTIYVSKFGNWYRIRHLIFKIFLMYLYMQKKHLIFMCQEKKSTTIGQDLKTSRCPLHSKHCNLNGFQIDLELQLEVRGIYIPHLGNPCHPLIPQPNMEQGGTTLKIAQSSLYSPAILSNLAPETNAKEQHTEKVQVYNHSRDKCKRHNPWFTYIFLNWSMTLWGWYYFLRGNALIVLPHMYL